MKKAKENVMLHNWFVALLVVSTALLIVFLSLLPGVSGVQIPVGGCLNLTLNGSNTTTMYCADQPANITLSLLLEPGQNKSTSNQYCSATATADSCDTFSVVCKRSVTLDPGEDYDVEDGACDLRFSCEQETLTENNYSEYNVPVVIRKDNDDMSITVDGRRYEQNLSDKQNLSISYDAVVLCPTTIKEDNIERFSDESLVRMSTMLGLSEQFINNTLRQEDDCRREINGVYGELSIARSDLMNERSLLSAERTSGVVLEEQNRELSSQNDGLVKAKATLSGINTVLLLSLLFVLGYAGYITYLYGKAKDWGDL